MSGGGPWIFNLILISTIKSRDFAYCGFIFVLNCANLNVKTFTWICVIWCIGAWRNFAISKICIFVSKLDANRRQTYDLSFHYDLIRWHIFPFLYFWILCFIQNPYGVDDWNRGKVDHKGKRNENKLILPLKYYGTIILQNRKYMAQLYHHLVMNLIIQNMNIVVQLYHHWWWVWFFKIWILYYGTIVASFGD